MFEEIMIFSQSTSWLEIVAMLTGILGVWLTVKQSIWCFPIGIINVSLYAILFFTPSVRLYADALLQCIYLILLVYGWIQWSGKKKETGNIQPAFTSRSQWITLTFLTMVSTILMGFLFQKFSNASFPYLDSFLTSVSLSAQWMIARKKIENWFLWIFADLVYIPMYLTKHLPLTSLLYFLFLVLAFSGWLEWKKSMAKSSEAV